jgi:pilus assembly protein CpaD
MTVRRRFSPRRLASVSMVPILAALLAGCASQHIEVGAIPDDYRTRHPITVREATEDLELFVASSDTRLTPADLTRMESFAARFRASRASVIRLGVPSGARNDAAARLVADNAAAVLRRHGISRQRILIAPYPAGGVPDVPPLLLSFNAVVAEVEPCGRWPEDLGDTSENRNYHNFGCASQSNLAAQIADPRDLLGPRGMSEIDAERRSTVIEKYRQGQRTASEPPRQASDYNW